MKYFKISPKDIEGAYAVKVNPGVSVPYEEQWIEYNGKKYWCRKIGSEEWTVTKIDEFPFAKLPKDYYKLYGLQPKRK